MLFSFIFIIILILLFACDYIKEDSFAPTLLGWLICTLILAPVYISDESVKKHNPAYYFEYNAYLKIPEIAKEIEIKDIEEGISLNELNKIRDIYNDYHSRYVIEK